jgi:tetratricopeptide (TPR) repeat protein
VSEDSNKKIVPGGQHSLVKSSSGLVRRGLDDLLLHSEKESVEETSPDFWLQRADDLLMEANRESNREVEMAQRAEAVSCYEKAIEIDPYCMLAWERKALCLGGMWRWRESLETLDKAIDRVADKAFYNSWKGEILLRLGEFEEAADSYRLALQLSSDVGRSGPDPPLAAHYRLELGASLHRLGRYEEAIQCFERFIAMVPTVAQDEQDVEQDVEQGRRPVLMRRINLCSAWTSKGTSLYRLGRWKESMECYDMAISIFPEMSEPWYKKGNGFREVKNFDEAIRCYNKAIEFHPLHPNTHARSWNYKSVCLRQLGRLDEAISCQEKVMSCPLELDMYDAGLYLEGRGRTADAIDAYQAYLADATSEEATPSEMNFIEKARERLQALKSRPEVNGPQNK